MPHVGGFRESFRGDSTVIDKQFVEKKLVTIYTLN
jgi:hypothetical protein